MSTTDKATSPEGAHTHTADSIEDNTNASVQQPDPEPRVDQSRRDRVEAMTPEEYDNWRMSADDHRWGDHEEARTASGMDLQRFEVDGGRYYLEGQEVDFTEPATKNKDSDTFSIQQSIRIYQPKDGIYWWQPENGTFSPVAGSRAGSGDTGTVPGDVPRGTKFPEENTPTQLKESDAHLQNIENAKEMRERAAPMSRR